jgi:hypothetical protein
MEYACPVPKDGCSGYEAQVEPGNKRLRIHGSPEEVKK